MKNSKNKNLIFFIVVALLICKNFAFANNEIGPGVNLETNISTVSCVYKPSSLPMPRKVDIRQKNIDSAKKYAIPPYAKIVDVEKIDDSIEGIDEDGDSADCNVTYLKPHIAYMQEEQIESINDKIDDKMEEIKEMIRSEIDSYEVIPEEVVFTKVELHNKPNEENGILFRFVIKPRKGSRIVKHIFINNEWEVIEYLG